jgi:glycosyltransferase involved in cell wall biosynthesis
MPPKGPSDISLSVFFPAYCEENNIAKMVHQALAVLAEVPLKDFEVIIVDDGSPDRTGAVADELAARYPQVRVVHHEKNLGYGLALRSGFKAARMDYVFYSDGDNQYDLAELPKFIALIPLTDIVSGFRIRKQYSTYRKITSFSYNLILRLLFDLADRDIDCAFKLYPRRLFEEIELESKDSFIDAEVAIKARAHRYRTTEVGVTHLPRTDGVSTFGRPSAIFKAIREMIKAYFKYGSGIKP